MSENNEEVGRKNEEGEVRREEDLRIRTKQFALRILKLYSALPSTTLPQVLGRQLLRSGTSVGANYREAYRARSKAEFIAKAGICLGEAEETAYWLELLVDGGIVSTEKLADLRDECNQIISIFVAILKKAKHG